MAMTPMVLLCLLSLLANCVTAFKFSKATPNADLVSLIRPTADDASGTFTHALEILEAIQASPSCSRIAASTLLDSCHSIQGHGNDGDPSMEDLKSIYAAQLAMCEIESANSVKPKACNSLIPSPKSKVNRSIHKDQLSLCLQSLESRPQWWTSYSNNRQNAGVMCQAARIDIEKDQLIKLHKSMVVNSADASTMLAKATNDANAALAELQNDFTLAKRAFQDQLLHEIDASTEKAQSFLERLVIRMDNAIQTAMSKVVSATREVETETAILGQSVQRAKSESIELQSHIGKAFQQVSKQGAELASAQSQQWTQGHEMAAQVHDSLQNMRSVEVNALLSVFHGMHNQLQASNELVISMHVRQNGLDERLLNLDKSFNNLESKAATFEAVQARQAEMQTRLHDQTQTELQVALGMLDEIFLSATNLKITVDSTAAIIGKLGSLTQFTRWLPVVGFAIMLLFALHLLRPRVAGYLDALLLLSLCAYFSGILDTLHAVQAYLPPDGLASNPHEHIQNPVMAAAIVTISVFLVIGCIHMTISRLRARRPIKIGSSSDLSPTATNVFSDAEHRTYRV